MTKVAIEELLRLPAKDRMELAQILWDSLSPKYEARSLSIPGWQRTVLSERQEDLLRSSGAEGTWEEVEAELWPKG